MPEQWIIEPLAKDHIRTAFDCGVPALNEFLARYARQNERRGLSRTFAAVRLGDRHVYGYSSLRSGAIAWRDLPPAEARRLPRYPVPVVHLARLAVDLRARGQGLGTRLLVHALDSALLVAEKLGVYAVEVIAKDDDAHTFYARFGFRSLADDAFHMYLPFDTIREVAQAHLG